MKQQYCNKLEAARFQTQGPLLRDPAGAESACTQRFIKIVVLYLFNISLYLFKYK